MMLLELLNVAVANTARISWANEWSLRTHLIGVARRKRSQCRGMEDDAVDDDVEVTDTAAVEKRDDDNNNSVVVVVVFGAFVVLFL